MNNVKKIAILVVIVGATIAGLIFYSTKSRPAVVEEPKVNTVTDNKAPQPVKPAPVPVISPIPHTYCSIGKMFIAQMFLEVSL